MTYGPWEEREDYQTPRSQRPFEIWYYYSFREGAVFVFEDQHGQHDYKLVHSNVEGERYSDWWAETLRVGDYRVMD